MVYTSYFSNVKRLAGAKPRMVFVSIAGKTPDWFDDCLIKVMKYKALAPKYEWWREWKDKFGQNPDSDESIRWYTDKYSSTILATTTPKKVYDDLMEISGREDVCLLCWEAPDRFCHRKLVREWLNMGEIPCAEADNGKGAE